MLLNWTAPSSSILPLVEWIKCYWTELLQALRYCPLWNELSVTELNCSKVQALQYYPLWDELSVAELNCSKLFHIQHWSSDRHTEVFETDRLNQSQCPCQAYLREWWDQSHCTRAAPRSWAEPGPGSRWTVVVATLCPRSRRACSPLQPTVHLSRPQTKILNTANLFAVGGSPEHQNSNAF